MPKRRVRRHEVIQPLDQSYRLIPLTQGQNAVVDSADYNWLDQWNWSSHWNKCTRSFYAIRFTRKEGCVRMSRQILGFPQEFVDHKNGNTLDNRRDNLRKSSCSGNSANSGKRKINTSGYKGVFRYYRKWRAQICCQYKIIYLGLFDSKEQAAHAYDDAAKKYFGEFAHLNFPTQDGIPS